MSVRRPARACVLQVPQGPDPPSLIACGNRRTKHRRHHSGQCRHRKPERQVPGRMPSVVGAGSSSAMGAGPSGVMLLSAVGSRARRMLAVDGEADHAKRRACVIARRSSTRHSCGLRLIPVPDGTGARARDSARDQVRPQRPSGTVFRLATCGASLRQAYGRPRSLPSSGCCAWRCGRPRTGAMSTAGFGSA